jgi:hypothetical protein
LQSVVERELRSELGAGLGLHFIGGRFVADAWQRARTFYGVTNERVLIVPGLFQRQPSARFNRSVPSPKAGQMAQPIVNPRAKPPAAKSR